MHASSKKLIGLLILTASISSCGKKAADLAKKNDPLAGEEVTVLENLAVAPKIDILLAQGNTDALKDTNINITQLIPGLLDRLTASGWNIHFTSTNISIPAITDTTHRDLPITQIAASRQDPNWKNEWSPEYPGQKGDQVTGIIKDSLFKKPANYSACVDPNSMQPRADDKTTGLQAIYAALTAKVDGTGFLRDDAMLAVWVISSQEDTSDTNLCGTVPCNDDKAASSLQSYKSRLLALKSDSKLFKMYSLVSKADGNCLNGTATAGTRYSFIAKETAGPENDYNLCILSVQDYFASLQMELNKLRGSMEVRYLFLGAEPEPTSIEVFTYEGGDAKKEKKIPLDQYNGWTYAKKVEKAAMIYGPVSINSGSGFAIELHGNAKMKATDIAKIIFQTPEQFKIKPRKVN